jgi:hypothetical protein
MLCSERAGCSASNPIGVDESKVTSQFALILGTLRMPARAGTGEQSGLSGRPARARSPLSLGLL